MEGMQNQMFALDLFWTLCSFQGYISKGWSLSVFKWVSFGTFHYHSFVDVFFNTWLQNDCMYVGCICNRHRSDIAWKSASQSTWQSGNQAARSSKVSKAASATDTVQATHLAVSNREKPSNVQKRWVLSTDMWCWCGVLSLGIQNARNMQRAGRTMASGLYE